MSLRSVLLALLSRQPNTGYGVGRLLHGELSHLWEASLQQIYCELGRLEREGLLDVESVAMPNRPAKKLYSLTATGREALDAWLTRQPAKPAAKDDLLVQVFCLGRVPVSTICRRLEQRRDDSVTEANAVRDLMLPVPRTDAAHLGHLLTLEASLARVEAEASWCDRALAILSDSRERSAAVEQEQRAAKAAG